MQQICIKRHDYVQKLIHWELCKKLEFDHVTKWFMHKPEFVKENARKFSGIWSYKQIT